MNRPPIVMACCAALVCAQTVCAELVVDGTIYWLGGHPPGSIHGGPNSGTISTVDYIHFLVEKPGPVEIDVLSMEVTGLPGDFQIFDINGDGEIAFLDPTIFLFTWDGRLDETDFILSVGDVQWPEMGTADGSIHWYDPFCRVNLAPGPYALAISGYWLRLHGAVTGVNRSSYGPMTAIEGVNWFVHDHGDYRVTFRGDVTLIPEPMSVWLFGTAALCLRPMRRWS